MPGAWRCQVQQCSINTLLYPHGRSNISWHLTLSQVSDACTGFPRIPEKLVDPELA